MADYIDREFALSQVPEYFTSIDELTDVPFFLNEMPSVDAVEQKHGHWIIKNTPPSGDGVFVCSECGSIDRDIGIPKFCRICGSKNSMKD